jgi:hypothetical protein
MGQRRHDRGTRRRGHLEPEMTVSQADSRQAARRCISMTDANRERLGRPDCSVPGTPHRPGSPVRRRSPRFASSPAALMIGTGSGLPTGNERPKALPERHLDILRGQQRGRDIRKIVEFGHLIRKGLVVVGLRRHNSAEHVELEATQRRRNKVRGHPVRGHCPCQARDHPAAESAVRVANHRRREIRVSYEGFAIRVAQRRNLIGPMRVRIRLTHRPHRLTDDSDQDVVHAVEVVVQGRRRDPHFRGNPARTEPSQPIGIDEAQCHGDNAFAGEQRFRRSRHVHKVAGIARKVYSRATSNTDRRRSPSRESQYPPDRGSHQHSTQIASRIPAVNRELDRMVAQFRSLRPAVRSVLGGAKPLAQDTACAKSPF